MSEPLTRRQLRRLLYETDRDIATIEVLLNTLEHPVVEPVHESGNTLHGITCDECDGFADHAEECTKRMTSTVDD